MSTASRIAIFCVGFLGVAPAARPGILIPPLTTVRVASGLSAPLYVCSPPGDYQRLFIVQQGGQIRILKNGSVLPTAFLNISSRIVSGGEQGLLGLAFHPNYAANGYFYVDYTRSGDGATVIARYHVSANPDVGDSASELRLLTIPQPAANHNGGGIQFGPDGYLYIGMGDGGGGCNQFGNAQNSNSLLGKMLRIDVDRDDFPTDPNKNYGIPATNPFASPTDGILDEIWDFGMRNPWRWSFDRQTGELWIGDVGQNQFEEIDLEPTGSGGHNYGWACYEGNTAGTCSGQTCNGMPLTFPIYVYNHSLGCAITGGYVYRGCAIPELRGTYFFSDSCSASIWTFNYNGTVQNFANRTTELAPGSGQAISFVYSFGEDAFGELYIVDGGGEVFKVVPRTAPPDCNDNGIADACDIAAGTSLDGNGNGIPDECESPCFTGTVNTGGGGTVADVLFCNGSAGDAAGNVHVALNAPITIALDAAPAGPSPGRYGLWIWRSAPVNSHPLVVGGNTLGCVLNPTPFDAPTTPQAFRCLRGGIGPQFCTGLHEITAPARAPWMLTRSAGFGATVVFTLQGVLQDANTGNPSGYSVTNPIVLRIP